MASGPNCCEKCQRYFDRRWRNRDDPYTTRGFRSPISHHSLTELREQANTGCHICRMFLESLSPEVLLEIDMIDPNSKVYFDEHTSSTEHGEYHLHIRHPYDSGDEYDATASVVVQVSDRCDNIEDLTKMGKIAPKTDSPESWNLVTKWIENCTSNHPECIATYMERVLPTRLLAVGLTDEDLHLVLTDDLPKDIQYLTLSHCWGRERFKTLQRDNIHELQRRIPEGFLTQTFQDAVITTRRLGHAYIWIDSLCIIQGDEDDWERESLVMGKIYAGSALNLAARDAADGSKGAFSDHEPGQMLVWKVAIKGEDRLWNVFARSFWNDLHYGGGILSSRAWVFQESVLSPRTLYLGRRQLQWECRSISACESLPLGIGSPGIGLANLPIDILELGFENTWKRVVEQYGRRELTYHKDKLIALSGVARLFSQATKASYVAGIWTENIEGQLIWDARDLHHTIIELERPYQAPSWSWASLSELSPNYTRHLRWPNRTYKSLISVEEISAVNATDDSFGQVVSGTLTLKCRAPCFGRIQTSNNEEECDIAFTCGDSELQVNYICMDVNSETFSSLSESLFLLPIVKSDNVKQSLTIRMAHSDVRQIDTHIEGIMLKEVAGGQFRRVGFFSIGGGSQEQKNLKAFENVWNGKRPRKFPGFIKSQNPGKDRDDKLHFGSPIGKDEEGCLLYRIVII